MIRFAKTGSSAALLLLTAISGCTDMGQLQHNNARAAESASNMMKQVGQATELVTPAASAVVHDDGVWVGKRVVKPAGPALPAVFQETVTFDRTVYSLQELLERLSLHARLPVDASADALAAAARMTDKPAAPDAASAALPSAFPGLPPGPPSLATRGVPPSPRPNPAKSAPGVHIVHLQGDFKSLLDHVAGRFGISWKYANGGVRFYFTDARTFQINSFPGEASFSASVSSGAAAGGSGAGAGGSASGGEGNGSNASNRQNTMVNSQLSVYANVQKTVEALLSSYGKVVASPATGTMTVIDTADVLERVTTYIERENSVMSRQVAINVTVLAVNLNDSDEYGINWNMVYSNLLNKYGIHNTLASNPNSVALSVGVLSTSGSKFAGSSVLINALTEQGQVRRQTSATVVTLNNQPVPVQVARQTSFLKSSETTITPLVGTTTTLTPGTLTSGFNMSILPHILDSGAVMLQFSTDISSLRGLRTVTSSNSTIETPEIDTRNFLQRVAMKSNETLIISGFEQSDDTLNRSGVGSAKNFLLGGGANAAKTKDIIVVLITPTTMAPF